MLVWKEGSPILLKIDTPGELFFIIGVLAELVEPEVLGRGAKCVPHILL